MQLDRKYFMDNRPDFIAVGGATASGKSSFAIQLAQAISGSIVCCDSVQLYRGFDIGSAKPTAAEQQLVPHYLFGLLDWSDSCDAAIYSKLAKVAINQIKEAGRIPIIVGGTGLYLRALMGDAWDDDIPSDAGLRAELNLRTSDDLFRELSSRDPSRACHLHPNDRFRVIRALEINILTGKPVRVKKSDQSQPRSHMMIFLNPPKTMLHEKINLRTQEMLKCGLVEEVRGLLDSGVSPNCKPMQSIGYKQVSAVLLGEASLESLEDEIATATRQYAKRQVTWFKKVPANFTLSSAEEISSVLEKL